MYEHKGTICGNVLFKWHQCAVGSSVITINNSIISQHLLEDEIQELDTLLGYNNTYTQVCTIDMCKCIHFTLTK